MSTNVHGPHDGLFMRTANTTVNAVGIVVVVFAFLLIAGHLSGGNTTVF